MLYALSHHSRWLGVDGQFAAPTLDDIVWFETEDQALDWAEALALNLDFVFVMPWYFDKRRQERTSFAVAKPEGFLSSEGEFVPYAPSVKVKLFPTLEAAKEEVPVDSGAIVLGVPTRYLAA